MKKNKKAYLSGGDSWRDKIRKNKLFKCLYVLNVCTFKSTTLMNYIIFKILLLFIMNKR